jgi:hypothetical protein
VEVSGPAADFPLLYPVLLTPLSVNGDDPPAPRAFPVNTSFEPYRRDAFRHRTIQAQRESISLTDVPGEGTVNTEGLWRRGAVDWHKGAGQLYADRRDSDDSRFYTSKGVDPWTPYQLTLLPDTTLQVAAAASRPWVATAVCEGYVYNLQTTALGSGSPATTITWFFGSYSSGTVPTGLSGQIYWIFSDGYYIYAAGTAGLFVTTPGASSWKQVVNEGVGANFCGYANGRVIMTNGPTVYDVTTSMGPKDGSAPTPLPTSPTPWGHSNPNWVWAAIAGGQGFIYLAGYSRDPATLSRGQSAVYALGEDSSTAVLEPGFVALPIEKGEQVTALYFYLNYIFVGSTSGVRMCSIAGTNNPDSQSGCLIPGPAIPNLLQPLQPIFATPVADIEVKGFIGFNRFVWFTWNAYDSDSVGLGRLDIGQLNGQLQPAYASDLMVSNAGGSLQNLEWCPITNGPLMVNGTGGLYTQNPDAFVASGTLDSGRLVFGIPDMKLAAQANFRTANPGQILPDGTAAPTPGGSVALSMSADGGSYATLDPLAPDTQTSPPVLLSPLSTGEELNLLVTLTAGDTNTTRPYLTRWTLKALPQVVSGTTLSPVFELYSTVDETGGGPVRASTSYDDYLYLESLRLEQRPIQYQEGADITGFYGGIDATVTQYDAVVVITEIDWLPFKRKDTPDGGYEGDLILYAKTIVG